MDLSIALAYIELAALPLGVGTCWAGLLRAAMLANPELVAAMGLPKGHTWFYPMMIGYPQFGYYRLPERKAPRIHWKSRGIGASDRAEHVAETPRKSGRPKARPTLFDPHRRAADDGTKRSGAGLIR